MEGRLGEHLEDKLFFHYPHLDNTAKDYNWIAALVVIPFVVVMMVVVVMVALFVKVYHIIVSHPANNMPSVSMDNPGVRYELHIYSSLLDC